MKSLNQYCTLRAALAATLIISTASACVARDIYIADPAADAIYAVDLSATNAQPTLLSASGSNTLGSGIPFQCILDIATAPNGDLFVLDGYTPAPRVIKVDLATGNRTLALALTGTGVFPQLHIRANEKYLVSRTTTVGEQLSGGGLYTQFEEYGAESDGTPILLTNNAIRIMGGPIDSALTGGKLRVMYPQLYGPWMITEAALSPLVVVSPDLKIAENSGEDILRLSSGVTPARFETTFAELGFSYPQPLLAAFVATYGASIALVDESRLIAPDGTVHTSVFGMDLKEHNFDHDVLHVGQFKDVVPSSAMGGWKLEMDSQFSSFSFVELVSASIWRMPSPNATQIADSPTADVLNVLESYPTALARFGSASATFIDRVPISPPRGDGDHLCDAEPCVRLRHRRRIRLHRALRHTPRDSRRPSDRPERPAHVDAPIDTNHAPRRIPPEVAPLIRGPAPRRVGGGGELVDVLTPNHQSHNAQTPARESSGRRSCTQQSCLIELIIRRDRGGA